MDSSLDEGADPVEEEDAVDQDLKWRFTFALIWSAARSSSKAIWSNYTINWSTDEPTRCKSPCVTASIEEARVAPTVVAISVWSKIKFLRGEEDDSSANRTKRARSAGWVRCLCVG